jgi:glutamyl-tRNA reductase
VAWAAVTTAQHVLGSLEGKDVLVLGSGKMGALAVQQLRNKGAGTIYVMNRTDAKAAELAQQCNGVAVQFWQIKEILEKVDVCICSTGAPHYLLDRTLIEQVMRSRGMRKLALLDIAVPGVVLLSVDELTQTLSDNMQKRMLAVGAAEEIIRRKLNEFYRALDKAALYEALHSSGEEKVTCNL